MDARSTLVLILTVRQEKINENDILWRAPERPEKEGEREKGREREREKEREREREREEREIIKCNFKNNWFEGVLQKKTEDREKR